MASLKSFVRQFENDANRVSEWASADENTSVDMGGGPVRSPAKLIKDNDIRINETGLLAQVNDAADRAEQSALEAANLGGLTTGSPLVPYPEETPVLSVVNLTPGSTDPINYQSQALLNRFELIKSDTGSSYVGYKYGSVDLILDRISGVPYVGRPDDGVEDGRGVQIRRVADYTGGTPGFVNAALRVDSTVGSEVTAFEWSVIGVMHNHANAGENVGIYGQGNQHGLGGTWGGVMEALDHTFTDSAGKKGLVGLEVDCYFNGEDVSATRMGLMVVAGDAYKNRNGGPGTPGNATYGILVLPQTGGADCQFKNGIVVQSATDTAFQAASSGERAFRVLETYQLGLDTSQATITQAAIKIAQGQSIAFDASAANQLSYDGDGVAYSVLGEKKARLNTSGGIELNGLRAVLSGSFSTGSGSAVLASNKPGVSSSTSTWLDVILDGQPYLIPAWSYN